MGHRSVSALDHLATIHFCTIAIKRSSPVPVPFKRKRVGSKDRSFYLKISEDSRRVGSTYETDNPEPTAKPQLRPRIVEIQPQ
jgi:lipopolysaccharide/colanic/teichoic acid biosynthesis glycosyltransferase